MIDRPGLDFSFSGLKTSVNRHVSKRLAVSNRDILPKNEVADICASFQRVVVDTLLDRTFRAARRYGAKSVGIAGGVSANSRLRSAAEFRSRQVAVPLFLPSVALATDNAAMIGAAGLRQIKTDGASAPIDLNAQASLAL